MRKCGELKSVNWSKVQSISRRKQLDSRTNWPQKVFMNSTNLNNNIDIHILSNIQMLRWCLVIVEECELKQVFSHEKLLWYNFGILENIHHIFVLCLKEYILIVGFCFFLIVMTDRFISILEVPVIHIHQTK